MKRAGLALAILLLLLVLPNHALAGSRTYVRATYAPATGPSPWTANGLAAVRVRCYGVGATGYMRLQGYNGATWDSTSTVIVPTGYYSLITLIHNPAASGLPNPTIWRLRAVAGYASVYVDYYETLDVYGDARYTDDLMATMIAPDPAAITGTLASGEQWQILREFTYGEITQAVILAGLAVVSFLGLAVGIVVKRDRRV